MAAPLEQNEIRLSGIGVSEGYAQGRVHLQGQLHERPEERKIASSEVADELAGFKAVIDVTRGQLETLQKEVEEQSGTEHSLIFDAHLLLLEDSTVIDEVVRLVEKDLVSIDWAYFSVTNRYIESLRQIADPYLRERSADIEDVAQRVLKNLRWPDGNWGMAIEHTEPCVVLAQDLSPSDTVGMDRQWVKGFATELGSPTAHTAIMARSLNIPAVVAVHQFPEACRSGDEVLIDGYEGLVIINPSNETLEEYRVKREREASLELDLTSYLDKETLTACGKKIVLSGNIELTEELELVNQQKAEGIGLYRTEFFYLSDPELRTEQSQAEIYREVVEAVQPNTAIIRTLDIGGDKLCPDLYDAPEPNPFLGWRGIRLSLDQKEDFKAQLRAILRASAYGKIGVMYPFLSNLRELRRANEVLEEC
ncbi:MAG: phosphoenolpyruvate--protein phosphotransferase, partial [Verrucomicrobiota bacterium]